MEDLIYVCIAVGIAILISLAEKKGKSRKSQHKANADLHSASFVWPDNSDFGDLNRQSTPPPLPEMNFQLPEEGQRVSDDSAPEELAAILKERERRLAAHRSRWRKAIVDAEIIQTKF